MMPKNSSSISVQRRYFLSLPISAGITSVLAVPIDSVEKPEEIVAQNITAFRQTFRAFIDTLLPADEFSKSASALGVDTAIIEFAESNKPYKLLIRQGCEWLNAAAKYEGNRAGKFASLSTQNQIRIVQVAETTGAGKAGPARFLHTVLAHANGIYYSRPEVWQSLGYNGPPQPRGFIDHDQAPLEPNV